jgi:hypothetical protein
MTNEAKGERVESLATGRHGISLLTAAPLKA